MKGLASDICNALNEYKLTIDIKKRDLLATSRAAVNLVSTDESTVEPEITKNSDAQNEADIQNVFRFAETGVKEGIAEGITKIVRKDITSPILQTTDDSNFKSVDKYQIH